ncbi:hypothetical protein PCANC_09453 [Puccinia coronata f. sp. avenae]|uniref:Peptidase A1 domain-containing protein n=1 Tax=Puccinia coronata f. sp. avenae TaxID=200324 RepID=A0A2N5SUG0_9BASI|nr:hypothetical protein PCANC_09453 [Puccinia coronata f. sp. avenae]
MMRSIHFSIFALVFSQLSIVISIPTNNLARKDFQTPSHSPTILQLSRRGSLTDETGVLDQKTLEAHLRYVLRKQVIGAMNYYKNTGNVLATFNMTPFELEDMYHSGSVPLISSNTTGATEKTDDAQPVDKKENPQQPISSLRAVNQPDTTATLSRASIRGTTIPLDNLGEKDLIWAAPIQVGNPPKKFLVSIDTGSSDFFLASSKCPTSQCAGKNIYTPQQSSDSQGTNKSYTVSFGDGSSVKADLMTDTVSIGGFTLPKIGVGVVTQLSPQFQSSTGDTSDGLMGFGFPSLSQSKTSPFFTALTKQNEQYGVMGSRFSRKSDSGSEITIGGVNPAGFKGAFTTLNVMAMKDQPPGFWDVSFDGAIVNGKTLKLSSSIATIDTGTSVIGVPQEDARAIYASIPGATSSSGGQFSFPCQSMPAVSMVFGGRKFDINPADMSIGKNKERRCVGGIIGLDKKGVWLVGQVFLKNVYTVYDQRNYTVSFADLS